MKVIPKIKMVETKPVQNRREYGAQHSKNTQNKMHTGQAFTENPAVTLGVLERDFLSDFESKYLL
jgi:hypothetical protein